MRIADLSVVIANRNHARQLPRALGSVLDQSVRPREIIVLDDDSSDDSLSVLAGFARQHDCLRVVRNERHLGVPATYSRGFALATGTYILPSAADDYILPGFLEQAIAQLGRHARAGLCIAHGSCTVGDDGPLIVNDPGWSDQPCYLSPEATCRRVWQNLPVSAIIVRRDALVEAGAFRPELAWYSDWFAFLVIAFRFGVVYIPETLGIHVLNPGSYATNGRNGAENINILGHLLDLLTSREYADVAPFFRRNGTACRFGPDLIRAAAARGDRLDPRVLGLIAGFAPSVYSELAADADPAVSEVARVFLQDPWRELIARRADLENENLRLIEEIQLTRLRATPPGTLNKIRWAARMIRRRIRKAAGLHPAGRFR